MARSTGSRPVRFGQRASLRGARASAAMRTIAPLLLMLTFGACGGGNSGDTLPPSLGTLAYVETGCRDTTEGFVERQALRIRQGDRQPVTVFETPGVGPIAGIGGSCRVLTAPRFGLASIARDAFQSVAVSPDGASVVFEVTDEFSVNPPLPLSPCFLLDEFREIQSVPVVLPLADSPEEVKIRCVVRPEPAQAMLLECLGLRLPQRLRVPAGLQQEM